MASMRPRARWSYMRRYRDPIEPELGTQIVYLISELESARNHEAPAH
jgi:hypothetical protein